MSDDGWGTKKEIDRIRSRMPDPDDEEEAERRFQKWRREDPFPKVPPTLLTAAQFCEYIAETGMIHPFELDSDLIKVATYDIKIGGKFVYWTDNGKKKTENISLHDTFTLEKNSISFVTLKPEFRIPDYIVARFNLKIRHIYKGLLLGTGPIVDPGFQGNLSIPLHNLTNNSYTFRGGEELISMEFTKLPIEGSIEDGFKGVDSSLFIPFDKESGKVDRDVEDYIVRAVGSKKIMSSIPQVFRDAKETVSQVESRSFWTLIASVVTVAIGVATIAGVIWDLSALDEFNDSAKERVETIDRNNAEIDSLNNRINLLEKKVSDDGNSD